MSIDDLRSELSTQLPELIQQFAVPGAVLAVRHGEHTLDLAAGRRCVTEPGTVDQDTVFEIGSVTKLWTAALVMQLVDDQLLDLDAPIRDALPEFTLADAHAAQAVTTRHLLTHAGGFEGDIFTDTGEDDDCLRRYVAELRNTPQYFSPGTVFSYSNAGYAVLGRLVEKVRGVSFDQAVLEHVVGPLQLTSVHPQPADVPRSRRAVGHRFHADSRAWKPTSDQLPRAMAPGGARLSMTAAALSNFGSAHCRRDGSAILSAPATHAMATPQNVDVPDLNGQWPALRGLGWEIDRHAGSILCGHDGDTIGQTAFLRVVPQADLSIALLTNGGDARGLYGRVVPGLLDSLGGVAPALLDVPVRVDAPAASLLVGSYAGAAGDYEVTGAGLDGLTLSRTPKGLVAEYSQPARGPLRHVRGCTFLWETDRPGDPMAVAFGSIEGGAEAGYLHNGRAYPRQRAGNEA